MKQVPSEDWPIKLLQPLAEELINFKGREGDFDDLAVKYGNKIGKKLSIKGGKC